MTGPINARKLGYGKLGFAINACTQRFLDANTFTLYVKSFAIF